MTMAKKPSPLQIIILKNPLSFSLIKVCNHKLFYVEQYQNDSNLAFS